MVKEIKVFTRSTCAPCRMVKSYLKYKGFSYQEIDVDEDLEAQAEAFELSGYAMVPLTVILKTDGSRKVISGYNITELAKLA